MCQSREEIALCRIAGRQSEPRLPQFNGRAVIAIAAQQVERRPGHGIQIFRVRPCNFVVNRHRRLQILPDHGFGKAAKRKLPSNFCVAWVEPGVELEGSRGAREIPEEIQGLPEATVERGNLIFKPDSAAQPVRGLLETALPEIQQPKTGKGGRMPRVELERLKKGTLRPGIVQGIALNCPQQQPYGGLRTIFIERYQCAGASLFQAAHGIICPAQIAPYRRRVRFQRRRG